MTAPATIGDRLTLAARQLLDAKLELETAKAAVDAAQAKVNDLEQVLLPALMEEAGCTKWSGADGLYISVSDKVRTDTKSAKLHEWLRRIGNGGLIKTVVEVPFNKGGDAEARAFVAELAAKEITASYTQDVHWSSLQALVRDMRKKGEDVPLAELNIHLMPEATIRLPGAKE